MVDFAFFPMKKINYTIIETIPSTLIIMTLVGESVSWDRSSILDEPISMTSDFGASVISKHFVYVNMFND